jgi:hypothetical protein
MPLFYKTSLNIGRSTREFRDDRKFIVATEDTYAPKQYFEQLNFLRVSVVIIPTPPGASPSPADVVARLKSISQEVNIQNQRQKGDEFWVLLDTDHRTKREHLKNTIEAVRNAEQMNFEVAFSNPCFELWLLLHFADLSSEDRSPEVTLTADEIENRLRKIFGSYNKTNIPNRFSVTQLPVAIQRARALENNPDNPEGRWPEIIGTRVYRLMEKLLGGAESQTISIRQ